MARLSEVYICKDIKLDRQHINVLDYTYEEMIQLCMDKSIAHSSNCSFLGLDNRMQVDFKYMDLLQCNYLFFVNPQYSQKYFFAWIDDIIYRSDNNNIITFTIDSWATYWSNVKLNTCYVVREHPVDDSIGANTLPEEIPTSNVWISNNQSFTSLSQWKYCAYINRGNEASQEDFTEIDGIPIALRLSTAPNIGTLADELVTYIKAGKEKQIIDVFVAPTNIPNGISVSSSGSLDGYTPKWNKLYTRQFHKVTLTNMQGSQLDLYWEYFKNPSAATFVLTSNDVPAPSVLVVPANYSGFNNDYTNAFSVKDFPRVAWEGDSFREWLAQNGIKLGLSAMSTALNMALGVVASVSTGSPLPALISGARGDISLAGQLGEMAVAKDTAANTMYGSIDTGNALVTLQAFGIYVIEYSQPAEYLRIADDFFTRFGYATKRIKTPNISSRSNFNFVKVEGDMLSSHKPDGYGSVPANALSEMNAAARAGITIWHSHDIIGNYG